jgi:hypothetical protein
LIRASIEVLACLLWLKAIGAFIVKDVLDACHVLAGGADSNSLFWKPDLEHVWLTSKSGLQCTPGLVESVWRPA